MNPQIMLKLLGQFQLMVDGTLIAGLTSEKIQALVAYVAVEQERVHSRDFLAELLWPDRPDGVARQNLRQALSRLQRALPTADEPPLKITRSEVRFNGSSDAQIDVVQFTRALDLVRNHAHVDVSGCVPCCQQLASAVATYQGDFLVDLFCDSPVFDEWQLLKAEWLRREAIQALDTLVRHHEANQRWSAVYHFAWRSVEIDPLREVAHQQVMRALAHSGRRKAALDQFATLTQLLRTELGVAPATASIDLFEAIRDGQIGPANRSALPRSTATIAKPACPHNLPIQQSTFIGRQQELQWIAARLAKPECHLLTLVGPGGAGKTRLALEVAAQALQQPQCEYTDGIYFVALAAVDDDEQILSAVAATIGYHFPDDARGMRERQRALLHHLQTKRLLLLLDNYEQIAESTALIRAMLAEAPGVQLLVTSRVPLHLRAEWLIDILGLTHPDAADLLLEERQTAQASSGRRAITTFEAVHFFTNAAQRLLADFTLSNQTLTTVGHLCLLTEGLPLALELAAAQIRTVPLPVLVEAVQRNLDTLATTMHDVPARHRSLRAVFDHSWLLLMPPLQQLFSQLALFLGHFDAEAATAVTGCAKSDLDQLCAYSLLRALNDRASAPLYAMHEVLRQYALEKLQRDPTAEEHMRQLHSRHFLGLAAATEALINGSDAAQGVALIQGEFDNIRAGWLWAATTGDISALQRSIPALLRFFVLTGRAEEGGIFAERALHEVESQFNIPGQGGRDAAEVEVEEAQTLSADLHAMRARMFFKQARYAEGIAHAAEALTMAEACNALQTMAVANLYWGICALNQGEYAVAQAKFVAALAHARAIGWRKLESDALRALGSLAHMQEDLLGARRYYEASLPISQELDDPRGLSATLGNVGSICRQQGDFAVAHQWLTQSLAIHRRIGDRSSEGRTYAMLGELSTDLEEYSEAERYFGEALQILQGLGEAHYVADALVALGKVYHAQERTALAVSCWQEAAATYEAAHETPMLAEVQHYLQQVQGATESAAQASAIAKGLHRL